MKKYKNKKAEVLKKLYKVCGLTPEIIEAETQRLCKLFSIRSYKEIDFYLWKDRISDKGLNGLNDFFEEIENDIFNKNLSFCEYEKSVLWFLDSVINWNKLPHEIDWADIVYNILEFECHRKQREYNDFFPRLTAGELGLN